MPPAGLRAWVFDPRWFDVFSHLSSLLNQVRGTLVGMRIGHCPGSRGGLQDPRLGGPRGPGHWGMGAVASADHRVAGGQRRIVRCGA